MAFDLGFPIIGGNCQIACHGWNHDLSEAEYFHLVDHHIAGGIELCEDDLRSFYVYAIANGKLFDNTYMDTSNGYNATYPAYGDTGVPGLALSGGGGSDSDNTFSGPEVIIDTPTDITIPSAITDTYIMNGVRIICYRPDPNDSTAISVVIYDSEDNIIGSVSDYTPGDEISVVPQYGVIGGGWVSILSDWTAGANTTWDGSKWVGTGPTNVVNLIPSGLPAGGYDLIRVTYGGVTPGGPITLDITVGPFRNGILPSPVSTLAGGQFSTITNLRLQSVYSGLYVTDVEYFTPGSSVLIPFDRITISGGDISFLGLNIAGDAPKRLFPGDVNSLTDLDKPALVQTHILEHN